MFANPIIDLSYGAQEGFSRNPSQQVLWSDLQMEMLFDVNI
jgi:hypothetical protein